MVMFTGLARVAREAGLTVKEESGWKTRGHGQMASCQSIIIHHTAGAWTDADYNSRTTILKGNSTTPGPLSQYGIGRNTGTVYVFAAGNCAHAGRNSLVSAVKYRNANAIGIEIENNGLGEPYTPQTYNAAVALAAQLVKEFGLKVADVVGHKEIALTASGKLGRKTDPSFSMTKFRQDVAAKIEGRAPVKVVQAPAAKPAVKPAITTPGKVWPAVQLPVNGTKTAEWHNAWVALMKATGRTHKSLGTNLQNWLDHLGYYKIPPYRLDGIMGPVSVKALQRFLKAKGHYAGLIDGDRGAMTVASEKRYLNAQAKHL